MRTGTEGVAAGSIVSSGTPEYATAVIPTTDLIRETVGGLRTADGDLSL